MARHDRTLSAIFAEPARANLAWKDIEALLVSLGAIVQEAEGSRVRFVLNGVPAVFHRPHPRKEASKTMVRAARRLLGQAGHAPSAGEE